MAKYVAPGNRAKRRKQQRARKMAMYSTIVIFILVISFGIVKVIELFQKDEGDIPILDNSGSVSTEDVVIDNGLFIGPTLEQTTAGVVQPDIYTIQATENGRVDVSYFNDAIFLGDSLADGFKVYAGWMSLKDTGAVYLTQQGTTPRTFLQPGAMVDAGRGPVDVWAVIEQRQPGKMYITLGTNALMAMDPPEFIESYSQLIDKIKKTSPDTVIYITTITPTTERKAAAEPRLSYERIYEANKLIAKMCNEKGAVILNLYDLLKDETGYLDKDIAAGDGYHLSPSGYRIWLDYLITHTKYDPDSPYVPGSPYYLEPKTEG